MAKQFTDDDAALLAELGVEAKPTKAAKYTAREERIIAGFEDIQRFVEEHGRLPQHGEERDIFERLYAVRLDRIRASEECMSLLAPMDQDGLLEAAGNADGEQDVSDDELLEALGVGTTSDDDITVMQHVRPNAERASPDQVAQRKPCDDFDDFRPMFENVQRELHTGERRTVPFKGRDNQSIEVNDWFVLDGQKAFVADAGELFTAEYGERDRRLRVIYDNGTESDLLMRSLRRALNKDEKSRRILPADSDTPPLFSTENDEDDIESGYIYVLRSLSDHPFIAQNRTVIHKIGVTGGEIKSRTTNAQKDPTYLLAKVEVVESYRLANVNRIKLEALLHQFFADARIDLQLRDRFGGTVSPREWYLVPLPVIQEAVELVMSGEIEHCRYDHRKATIVRIDSPESP